ncbi:hypothetical protein EYF80_035070 [Liparis tanakae]|uniref:Uncharacterized protein n=1 Tax=Liparis tanakae TaxID=230148 RepID=A0A4Z2GME2_9TELE|nr:hypothetical protein EYF80_035070 [Liparis tanakae]
MTPEAELVQKHNSEAGRPRAPEGGASSTRGWGLEHPRVGLEHLRVGPRAPEGGASSTRGWASSTRGRGLEHLRVGPRAPEGGASST